MHFDITADLYWSAFVPAKRKVQNHNANVQRMSSCCGVGVATIVRCAGRRQS